MEHLCKGCIELLKENWNYKAEEISVMIVSQKQCDNTSDSKGIMNLDKKLRYPKAAEVIKMRKGEKRGKKL